MFLDYLRNGQGSTAICPCRLGHARGRCARCLSAGMSCPPAKNANGFDVFAAAARAQLREAWEGYFDVAQTLTDRIRHAVRQQ